MTARATKGAGMSPGGLKSGYLVFGDDPFLVEKRVAGIVSHLVAGLGGEAVVDRIDCEETGLEGVVEELVSPSLFSSNKITVLRHFRLTAENRIAKEIERCLSSGLAPGQYLVIEADKVDKRLKLAKMMDDQGGLCEEKRPDAAGLHRWIAERFAEHGKSVEPGVPDLLADLQGDDLRALASEIEKTSVYLGGAAAVTEADLQQVVGRSRTERIFELTRQVIQGKRGEAIGTVADLLDSGDSGVRIVGYLGREVRWLVQIKLFLRGRPRLWDRGTTFPEFRQQVLPAFKAWTEACGISEEETFLRQKPYAAYMKFREAERPSLDGLLAMLERLVETNRFLVSKSVEHKDRLALEALVSAC